MSHKLFSEARSAAVELGKPPISSLETPYVVLQKNKLFLDDPQKLFTFQHPNKGNFVKCVSILLLNK